MQTYKATNGVTSYLKNFADLETAKAYFLPILGDKYTVTLASESEQIPTKTPSQKLFERQEFGKLMVIEYYLDNDALAAQAGSPMDSALSYTLANQFNGLKVLLEGGSIIQAKDIITAMTTDSIFTQERKDKYLGMINAFLQSWA